MYFFLDLSQINIKQHSIVISKENDAKFLPNKNQINSPDLYSAPVTQWSVGPLCTTIRHSSFFVYFSTSSHLENKYFPDYKIFKIQIGLLLQQHNFSTEHLWVIYKACSK